MKMQSSTPMPSIFWRSPYLGETGTSSNKELYLRPIVNVTSPRYGTLSQAAGDSRTPVKSILKHRSSVDTDTEPTAYNQTPLPTFETPKLVSTGNAVAPRPETTGKRVKFNPLPKKPAIVSRSQTANMTVTQRGGGQYRGRRLYLDHNTSSRILGSASRTLTTWSPNKAAAHPDSLSLSLSGGESNIKSQINTFIRKLRLAEREKVPRINTAGRATGKFNTRSATSKDKGKADTCRNSRDYSTVPVYPEWTDYDIDKLPQVVNHDLDKHNVIAHTENLRDDTFSSKADSASTSGSVSIESFDSPYEEKVEERPTTEHKPYRTRPKASAYTKYRHITESNINKYNQSCSARAYRYPARVKDTVNYCDSGKTDQILGWLQEVHGAHDT